MARRAAHRCGCSGWVRCFYHRAKHQHADGLYPRLPLNRSEHLASQEELVRAVAEEFDRQLEEGLAQLYSQEELERFWEEADYQEDWLVQGQEEVSSEPSDEELLSGETTEMTGSTGLASNYAAATEITKTTEATDMVNHPPHYTSLPNGIECIDVVENFSFLRGSAIKYLWRADEKGNTEQDLAKAAWYVNRELGNVQKAEAARVQAVTDRLEDTRRRFANAAAEQTARDIEQEKRENPVIKVLPDDTLTKIAVDAVRKQSAESEIKAKRNRGARGR